MDLKISFDDALSERIIAGMCGKFNYSATILDDKGNKIPNPIGPVEFVRGLILSFIKGNVKQWESGAAAVVASKAAADKVDAEIIIT